MYNTNDLYYNYVFQMVCKKLLTFHILLVQESTNSVCAHEDHKKFIIMITFLVFVIDNLWRVCSK